MTTTTKDQIAVLREQGYVIVPGMVPAARREAMLAVVNDTLLVPAGALEFEADLRYPGAPPSRDAAGGATIRRLRDAYARDAAFAAWACDPEIAAWMTAYFNEPALLSRAHHNCVMTKHPLYGSLTGWHRDIRYWSFGRPDLVSTWLALGDESSENGGLWVVPGSHAMTFAADQFDGEQFFVADDPRNVPVLAQAIPLTLAPGDVLLFHCRTLHAASQNATDRVKISVVNTYHAASNPPLPGTRSASVPDVPLDVAADQVQ